MVIVWSSEVTILGTRPLVFGWPTGGSIPTTPPSVRGNIDYDQIRVAARSGNGSQLLTWQTPAPAISTSAGTPGMTAYDAIGNFCWCYATNQWARIGPGGYSNTF